MVPYTSAAATMIVACLHVVVTGDNVTPATASSEATTTGAGANKQRLAGYEPLTSITNYANIDLDMQSIEQMVDYGLVDLARAMYEHGGHSRSVSNLTLINNPTPPTITIPAGAMIIGRSIEGTTIQGVLLESITPWDDSAESVSLSVEYDGRGMNDGSQDQTSSSNSFCRLGGLATAGTADIQGCFEYGGSIQILDFISQGSPVYHYDYRYDPYVNSCDVPKTFQEQRCDVPKTFQEHRAENASS